MGKLLMGTDHVFRVLFRNMHKRVTMKNVVCPRF